MEDWDDYKFILAVGRHGGLSAAARHLKVNHSTVSRRITAAEKRLGARLFDRMAKGFVPTQEGKQAIEVAAKLEQELFALNRSIAAKDKNLAGPLNITAPQLIFQSSIAEIITKFSRLYPEIDITVRAANENFNLNKREADVAIRVGDNPDENLYGQRLTKQNSGFYANTTYLNEFSEYDGVSPNTAPVRSVNFTWWGAKVTEALKAKYPNVRTGIKLDDMMAVHIALQQGLGIGRIPCYLGDCDPALMRIPGLPILPLWDIWILAHPDLKNVERVRVFMRFVAAEFKRKESLYLGI